MQAWTATFSGGGGDIVDGGGMVVGPVHSSMTWKELALGEEGLRIGDEECGFGKAQQRQRPVRPQRLRTRATTAAAAAAASMRVAMCRERGFGKASHLLLRQEWFGQHLLAIGGRRARMLVLSAHLFSERRKSGDFRKFLRS